MIIREHAEADIPALKALVHALHVAMRAMDPNLPPADDIVDAYFNYLVTTAKRTEGTWLVAEDDGEIVAYLCLFGRQKPAEPDQKPVEYSFISDLYVKPEYHRKGIGESLVAAAEDCARRLGTARLDLAVLPQNRAAIAFYERLGFAPKSLIMARRIQNVSQPTNPS